MSPRIRDTDMPPAPDRADGDVGELYAVLPGHVLYRPTRWGVKAHAPHDTIVLHGDDAREQLERGAVCHLHDLPRRAGPRVLVLPASAVRRSPPS